MKPKWKDGSKTNIHGDNNQPIKWEINGMLLRLSLPSESVWFDLYYFQGGGHTDWVNC